MKYPLIYFGLGILLTLTGSINGRKARISTRQQTIQDLNGIHLELIKQLPVCDEDKGASEVFQFSGYIFARCTWSESLIHVFDAKTYTHLGDTRWNIPGDSTIEDLHANPYSKSLYIRVDTESGTSTWKITVNNNSSTLYNTVNYSNSMHSVSAKDHALIMDYSTDHLTLHVYGADGRELERITLPHKVLGTFVEETETGTYLFGGQYLENDPFTVKEVSKEGKIIQSYRPFSKNPADQLFYPFRMITDKYGHIFVTAIDSPSLFVIDKNLTTSRAILTVDNTDRPFYTLSYDAEEEVLLVVPFESVRNIVNIYKIHYIR